MLDRRDDGGADSIDDLNVLRNGAMTAVFGGVRAPSTRRRSRCTMSAAKIAVRATPTAATTRETIPATKAAQPWLPRKPR